MYEKKIYKIPHFIVEDKEERKDMILNYKLYAISFVDKNDNKKIICYRRFDHFDLFSSKIKSFFPYKIIPVLEKNYLTKIGQVDNNFYNIRKKKLTFFLNFLLDQNIISIRNQNYINNNNNNNNNNIINITGDNIDINTNNTITINTSINKNHINLNNNNIDNNNQNEYNDLLKKEELSKKFFETEFDENYFKSNIDSFTYYPVTSQFLNNGIFSKMKSFIFGDTVISSDIIDDAKLKDFSVQENSSSKIYEVLKQLKTYIVILIYLIL